MQNRPDREVQCEGLLQALPPEMEPICDSRGEVKDKIFVCIKGGRHDGHTDAAGRWPVCVPVIGVSRPKNCESSALPAQTARPLPPTCCATCCKAPGLRPGALGRTA